MLGDARPGVRRRHVPGLEPLGLRLVRRRRRLARRAHPPAGVDRHRRRRAGHGRGDVGRRARLRRPVPRQQPGLRPQAVGQPRVQRPGASSRSGRSTSRSSGCRSRSTCRPAATRAPSAATAGRSSTTSATAWRRRSSRSCRSSRPACSSATPDLQAGLVESGIGFVPWLLETMDYAYRAHHMWVRPVIPELPSHVLPAQLLRHVPGGPRRPRGRRAATTSSTT